MFNTDVHVVFDLDDTLYSEVGYVDSALEFIGKLVEKVYGRRSVEKELRRILMLGDSNPIQTYWTHQKLPAAALTDCISAMRAHRPKICLRQGAGTLIASLNKKGIHWSVLTDGRSITQRQKILALGLMKRANGIYISEECGIAKPNPEAYRQIERDFPEATRFFYIADNPSKDFCSPNDLGWITAMLKDEGSNIHKQNVDLPIGMQAHNTIENLTQFLDILDA
jgi:putative hydrolase of the HAD superfamily